MSLGASLINKAIFGTKHTGTKPIIPDLPALTTFGVQTDAISGNLKSIPEASTLAAKVNLFNQEQLDKLAEMASPGRAGIREQERGVIGSMLRGELPKDVENLVLSRANARAQGGGYGGTGAAGALGARDLGITSLDLTNRGIDAASKWLAQSQTAPLFNLSNMFFSPEQTAAFQFQERGLQQQNKLLQAQVKAAPDPGSAAIATEVDRLFNTFAQFGMASLGGVGGMMGGGGGGAPSGGGGGGSSWTGGGAYGGWGSSGSAGGKGI